MFLADLSEVSRAFYSGGALLNAYVTVRITESVLDDHRNSTTNASGVDTTIGHALLFRIVPKGLPFSFVNQTMKKKSISNMINQAYFFFQAEDGIRDLYVTGVQTCALPI